MPPVGVGRGTVSSSSERVWNSTTAERERLLQRMAGRSGLNLKYVLEGPLGRATSSMARAGFLRLLHFAVLLRGAAQHGVCKGKQCMPGSDGYALESRSCHVLKALFPKRIGCCTGGYSSIHASSSSRIERIARIDCGPQMTDIAPASSDHANGQSRTSETWHETVRDFPDTLHSTQS